MEKINVRFFQKKKAREAGAYFDRQTREWFIPDDISSENEMILRSLEFETENDIIEDFEEPEENIMESNHSEAMITPISSDFDWENVLNSNDTLVLAMAVRDHGLPITCEQRATLFRILSRRSPNEYPIEFQALYDCNPAFALSYPPELITQLVKENISSGAGYESDIRNSTTLTEDQKELLMFIFPLV